MITLYKNWGIQGNSAKSTNNPMSSFGLIGENIELSHTDYAVKRWAFFSKCVAFSQYLNFNKNYDTILFEEAQMESACRFLDDALPSTFFAMMYFHPTVEGLGLVFC